MCFLYNYCPTKFQWSALQIGQDSSTYKHDIILGWVYDIISISFAYFIRVTLQNACTVTYETSSLNQKICKFNTFITACLLFITTTNTTKRTKNRADLGVFLGGGAPLRNDVINRWGKQILKANTKKKASSQRGEGAHPAPWRKNTITRTKKIITQSREKHNSSRHIRDLNTA